MIKGLNCPLFVICVGKTPIYIGQCKSFIIRQYTQDIPMSDLTTLYKPCGAKIRVNDSSLEHAISLGWSEYTPLEAEAKKAANEKAKADKLAVELKAVKEAVKK